MQGEMSDDAGKVWTYLAENNGWRNFIDIAYGSSMANRPSQVVAEAIGFWLDNGELEVRQRKGFTEYRIAKKEPSK